MRLRPEKKAGEALKGSGSSKKSPAKSGCRGTGGDGVEELRSLRPALDGAGRSGGLVPGAGTKC